MKKYLYKRIAMFGTALVLAGVACLSLPQGTVYGGAIDPKEEPEVVLSSNQQAVCEAIGSDTACSDKGGGGASVNSIVSTVINIFTVLIGIVAVIMIIVAGFKYITSAGDAAKLTSAKNTLVYALVGLVVVALSQFIVKFVLNKVTQ